MLPPLAKIHLGFFKKYALNRSLACAAVLAQFFQRSLVRSIRKQSSYHSHRPGVRRMRQLQWDGLNGLQLIDNDFDNASLVAAFLFNFLNLHAYKISSLRSDDTFMTKHFPRNAGQSFGRK